MNPILPLKQFTNRVKKYPNKVFLHQPVDRKLKTYTWAEVNKQAKSMAQSMLNLGLIKGDRVGILSKNCAEWFITDIAIMMAGLISVPIYPTANRQTISYVIEESDCKIVFVGKLDDFNEADAGISSTIKRVIFPYESINGDFQWCELLKTEPITKLNSAHEDDTLTISYTSGSTGHPKGVVLSHNNIASAASTTVELLHVNHKDHLMSYLPLAHITERSLIENVSFYSGCEVFFVESLDTFIDDVKIAEPDFFISVPRLWIKFQTEINNKIPDKKLQKLLKIPLIGQLVAKKIRQGLGLHKARSFGSGTAPISPNTLKWYDKIGIPISEGWGMTETSGLSCSNQPFNVDILGSIGKPLNCVEMKVDDNQEILIRGPAVFKEYYLNPDATKSCFTNGWYHTGDMGTVTKDKVFYIIGRLKEQFKTAKGKYVVPAPIENLLSQSKLIEQVCVYGQGRKQPMALVVLNQQNIKLTNEQITKKLNQLLIQVNQQLESHKRLDHIIVLKDEWTIENNLLTPTLKIKRSEIESKFNYFIDQELTESIIWQ